jgi:hypothetical protein
MSWAEPNHIQQHVIVGVMGFSFLAAEKAWQRGYAPRFDGIPKSYLRRPSVRMLLPIDRQIANLTISANTVIGSVVVDPSQPCSGGVSLRAFLALTE